LKNEKVELLASITAQFAKVHMCKEKLHDVLGGASGMREAFQTMETTLTNVKGAAK
jgi:phage-related protein